MQELEPVLDKLEKNHHGIKFVKLDIDEHDSLANEHNVEAVPTILFVKKGKVVKKIVGCESYETLSRQAKKLLS